jgi:hypothetical protein
MSFSKNHRNATLGICLQTKGAIVYALFSSVMLISGRQPVALVNFYAASGMILELASVRMAKTFCLSRTLTSTSIYTLSKHKVKQSKKKKTTIEKK